MYFIDESLNENTSQLSFHKSGKVHIKHYGKEVVEEKEYEDLFRKLDLFQDDRLHQFIYYKLGDINYYPPIPRNEILKPNLMLESSKIPSGKMMIKFLIGKLPLKSGLIHSQHATDREENHLVIPSYIFNNKLITLSPLLVEGADLNDKILNEYCNGIHVILFNSDKEIPDAELFKKKMDIGKLQVIDKDNFQIDWKEEDVDGEKIISIFYRINSPLYRNTIKRRIILFIDWIKVYFKSFFLKKTK